VSASRFAFNRPLLALLLAAGSAASWAQQTPPPAKPAASTPVPDAAGQAPAPPPVPPPGQKLTPNQLDGLVAPIALYPDPLVTQVLVASTYPREVTEAVRWLNQHPDLKGKEVVTAAQDQSWDPSIKALVMFPGVLRRLNQDKEWTTNLGNAFLAQQADVMQAIQRMRRVAKEAGKLRTSQRMKVVETTDSGQTVIEIVPAAPDVIFVPAYNPAWIWGPAVWYPYPRWVWGPPPVAAGVWFGYGPAVTVGAYFGPGWGGWGGWGWRPGWVSNTVVVNNTFISRTTAMNTSANASSAADTAGGAGRSGTPSAPASPATGAAGAQSASQTSTWSHDPSHRQGVPYPNKDVAQRYNSAAPAAAKTAPPAAKSGGRPANGAGRPGRRAPPPKAGGRNK